MIMTRVKVGHFESGSSSKSCRQLSNSSNRTFSVASLGFGLNLMFLKAFPSSNFLSALASSSKTSSSKELRETTILTPSATGAVQQLRYFDPGSHDMSTSLSLMDIFKSSLTTAFVVATFKVPFSVFKKSNFGQDSP